MSALYTTLSSGSVELVARIIWALEEEEMFLNGAVLILQLRQQGRRHAIVRKRRTVWTRGWLLNRPLYGQYENLLAELNQDFRGYKNFLRISNELFEELVHHVGPHIQKITTPWKQPLSVGLRLAITLRYMASGDSFMSLQYSYNTISCIVKETTMAIVREYMGEVMKCHTTPQEWINVAEQLSNRWNFHHTIGAIDGKHIDLKCPANPAQSITTIKVFTPSSY